MSLRVAINGFGRIGRLVFRVLSKDPRFEVAAINDLSDAATLAHLLRFDPTHGRFAGRVEVAEGALVVDGRRIRISAEKDPAALPHRAERIDWVVFTWVTGFLFGEEAITTEKYIRLFPYGLTQANEGRFASAVQQGYLTVNDKGEYRPSDSGLEVLEKIWRAVDASPDHLDPMPKEGVHKLVDYLTRLAGASFIMPEPPAKWLISYKRGKMRPVEDSCLLRHAIYYYDQIAAYRVDMYVATWQAHGVEGHTWEVLDRLSQNDALTFDELNEKTSERGVTREADTADVQELAADAAG